MTIAMFPHFLKANSCIPDGDGFVAVIKTAPVPVTVNGVTQTFCEAKLTSRQIDSILREGKVSKTETQVLQAARQSLLALRK